MMETWLPHKLRTLRVRQGLTLIDAAKKTGVTRATLSELERGHRHPVAPTLVKIAKGYGVPVEELIEEPALAGKAEAPEAGPAITRDSLMSSPESEKERREELRMFRELLTDAHGLLEEMADEYRKAGATDKLKTLVNVAMFSAIGAEQFVKEEVGPARDRASTRVYAAGNRLEEFIEDLLETIQSTTTEPVGGEVAYLDAHRRRRAG